ncbi:MAG: anion transporter [Bryobacterales bacterium]|nr:anion transporter [Bryobacterales bacterium]
MAIAIFLATFFVLAVGRLPGLRIDRTGAAIIGASLMVASGVLTMEEAWHAINSDTILLLFGMMIVVANLRLAGFFTLAAGWVIGRTHRPRVLLAAVVGVSGALSAFFVNDTVCLILTPLVLEIATTLRRNPLPYLIGVATASNIGSACTITGNPQNMLIGTFSRIPYSTFTARLAPVSLIGLALAVLVIIVVYRDEFTGAVHVDVRPHKARVHWPMLWKSLLVAGAMIAAFFAGVPVDEAALVAGAILLITRRIKPDKVYREIDFALLVMFAGLFIVVAGIEKTSLDEQLFAFAQSLRLDRLPVMAFFATLLSNLVSNVPAVLIFKPVMPHLADPQQGWLALALFSTFAGNTTLLASVANLIVVQKARHEVEITFREYLRVGLPLTLLTMAAGLAWLMLT